MQHNKEYKYTSRVENFFSPIFKKYFSPVLYKIFPVHFPANAITILANCAAIVAFVISWRCYITRNYSLLWVAPVGIVMYLLGDDFDGCQARRSNTSSAFGEFLDHFLDSISSGLSIACVLFAYGITNKIVIFSAFFCVYASQTMTFLEKKQTGIIHFGKLTSDEALIMIAAGLTAACFEPVRTFFLQVLFVLGNTPWSGIDLLIQVCMITSLSTFYLVVKRMHTYHTFIFLGIRYLVCSALVIALCTILPHTALLKYTLIILYQTTFCGMILLATVTEKTPVFPDYALPALLIYGKIVPIPAFALTVAAVYLALFSTALFLFAFREYFPERPLLKKRVSLPQRKKSSKQG